MGSDSGNPSPVSRICGYVGADASSSHSHSSTCCNGNITVLGNKGIYCIFERTISSTMPTSSATLIRVIRGIASAAEVRGSGFRV